MLDGWSEPEALAVLGAMRAVAAPIHNGVQSAGERLVAGAAAHVFEVPIDADTPAPANPQMLAAAVADVDHRQLALELLILVPYGDHTVDGDAVGAVDAYADALGIDAHALADLHKVRKHHINRLLLDYGRRQLGHLGPDQGHTAPAMRTLLATMHQYVGDKSVAARYQALSNGEPGTLGRELYDFYRARGFPLPGERHSLSETLIAHDCCHILAGFNTDGTGEINVAGFEAGMRKTDFGFEMLMEVLLDFELGISLGGGAIGFVPKTGELDPDTVMVGIRRGLDCTVDLLGPDWNLWAVADQQVLDLRQEYGITGVTAVTMAPPDHPATGA